MPHFKYPNATMQSVAQLETLVDQLLASHPDPLTVERISAHLVASHCCNMVAVLIASAEINRGFTPDPHLIQQIQAELKRCM